MLFAENLPNRLKRNRTVSKLKTIPGFAGALGTGQGYSEPFARIAILANSLRFLVKHYAISVFQVTRELS